MEPFCKYKSENQLCIWGCGLFKANMALQHTLLEASAQSGKINLRIYWLHPLTVKLWIKLSMRDVHLVPSYP